MDDTHEEDKVLDLEGVMVPKQCSEQVRKILSWLPVRDRELLRAVSGKGERYGLPGDRGGSQSPAGIAASGKT
jgi:hypothetical protein